MDRVTRGFAEASMEAEQFYGMISLKFIMELLKVEKTVKQLDIETQKLE